MSSPTSYDRCLDAERRRRASLLPPDAICEACGEDDPLLLELNVSMLLCADDAAIDRRQEPTERHHLAGRRWLVVLDLTPNWHRIVTALQHLERGVTHGKMAELLRGIAYLIFAVADYLDHAEDRGAKKRG